MTLNRHDLSLRRLRGEPLLSSAEIIQAARGDLRLPNDPDAGIQALRGLGDPTSLARVAADRHWETLSGPVEYRHARQVAALQATALLLRREAAGLPQLQAQELKPAQITRQLSGVTLLRDTPASSETVRALSAQLPDLSLILPFIGHDTQTLQEALRFTVERGGSPSPETEANVNLMRFVLGTWPQELGDPHALTTRSELPAELAPLLDDWRACLGPERPAPGATARAGGALLRELVRGQPHLPDAPSRLNAAAIRAHLRSVQLPHLDAETGSSSWLLLTLAALCTCPGAARHAARSVPESTLFPLAAALADRLIPHVGPVLSLRLRKVMADLPRAQSGEAA